MHWPGTFIDIVIVSVIVIRTFRSLNELVKSSEHLNVSFLALLSDLGPYSQHFIVFVTSEWALKARLLHCTRMARLARDKHFSLLRTLISKEVNNSLRIQLPLVLNDKKVPNFGQF
jgi:hypothetical protein